MFVVFSAGVGFVVILVLVVVLVLGVVIIDCWWLFLSSSPLMPLSVVGVDYLMFAVSVAAEARPHCNGHATGSVLAITRLYTTWMLL